MKIENMTNTELSDTVFDGLANRVHEERLKDPSWETPTALSHMFSVKRHGHELSFRKGDGLPLLRGEMRWREAGGDAAKEFSVWRSKSDQLLLKFEVEADESLEQVIEIILTTFLVHSEPE